MKKIVTLLSVLVGFSLLFSSVASAGQHSKKTWQKQSHWNGYHSKVSTHHKSDKKSKKKHKSWKKKNKHHQGKYGCGCRNNGPAPFTKDDIYAKANSKAHWTNDQILAIFYQVAPYLNSVSQDGSYSKRKAKREIKYQAYWTQTEFIALLDKIDTQLNYSTGECDPAPKPDCGCEGKVDYLKLRYDGLEDSVVTVSSEQCGVMFSETLSLGDEFEVSGEGFDYLPNEITISRDGTSITVDTSCNTPIGPGTLFVDPIAEAAIDEDYAFVVLEGSSREIDLLCEQAEIPPIPEPPTDILPPIVEAGPDITILDSSSVALPNVDQIFGEEGNTGAFERVAELLQVDGEIVSYVWTREEIFYSEPLRQEPFESSLLVAALNINICNLADVEGDICSVERYTITVTDENDLSDTDSFTVTTVRSLGSDD